jgi:hypothetical protein
MRKLVNASMRSLFALAFVSACAFGGAHAQSRTGRVVPALSRADRVVSARAGGVNFVSGEVKVRSGGETEWRDLWEKDELRSGDAVRTGADGRVEILLNPGSYFRAGEGAEFTLADASLDDLRVTLSRGSAVVEATGYSDIDLSITVATPRSRVRIIRSGIYRIDVPATGAAAVSVLKGRARVGSGELVVKGGRRALAGEGGVEVSKLDKRSPDALDLWSRERGRELARANEKLTRRSMTSLFAQVKFDGLFGAPNRYGYSGLWFWSADTGCYTFLPFYPYWQSPYGFGYLHKAMYFSVLNSACNCRETFMPPGIVRNGEPYNPPTWTPSQNGNSSSGMTGPLPGIAVSEGGASSRETTREPSQPTPRVEITPGAGPSPRDRP